MKEKILSWIDENTLMPISFILVLVGAVFWVAMLSHSAQNSETRIDEINKQIQDQSREVNIKMDYIHGVMLEMNRSLGRIEGKISP
jgi:hypothetical protein